MKYQENKKELNQKEIESVSGGKSTRNEKDLEVKTWKNRPLLVKYGGPRLDLKNPILTSTDQSDPIPKTALNEEECKDLGEEPKNI